MTSCPTFHLSSFLARPLLLSLPLSGQFPGPAHLPPPHTSRYPVAVDCSWTPLGAPNSTMSYIATYRLGVAAQQQSRLCLQPNPQATRCTIPRVQLFSMVPYLFNVTAVQPGGASSSLLAFVAERIRYFN
ncbi:interleukin-27 subunit beta-like [Onychomys torridus]|uniref:interleukin-27 subunit beta-like n=1 Tax=Onychomys torridus TaxID=38674 RepID=UPI00167FD03B|nr:interleukin-27 subunit beta-like [Onychomys torridus]